MASEHDSFIDEVTEDLRRDRLFAAMRRYGWVVALLIAAIVAGTAWREWRQSRETAAARAFGDAVLAAEAAPQPATALTDLAKGADAPGRRALAQMLAAGRALEAGDHAAAEAALSAVAADAGAPALAREAAQLKAALLAPPGGDPAAQAAALDALARPGGAFRLIALEQKAVALIAAGRRDEAIAALTALGQEEGLTQNMRRRRDELLVTLGVDPAAAAAPAAAPAPAAVPAAPAPAPASAPATPATPPASN